MAKADPVIPRAADVAPKWCERCRHYRDEAHECLPWPQQLDSVTDDRLLALWLVRGGALRRRVEKPDTWIVSHPRLGDIRTPLDDDQGLPRLTPDVRRMMVRALEDAGGSLAEAP